MNASDQDRQAVAGDPAELQQFLLFLGSTLTSAGEAVNEIQDHLQAVASAYGAPDARIAVLPTLVVVSLDPRQPATLEPTHALHGMLRLDQTAAIYGILKRAERAAVDPRVGCQEILDVLAMRPRFGWFLTVVGHVVLTLGICLVLQPSPGDLLLAGVFGALVGLLKLVGVRWPRVQTVMPVGAALLVAAATFLVTDLGWVEADLRAMIAPLVTFLPGAMLTIAVVELSGGEMVTGASRLVAGSMQLVLLGFGIVAGAQLVDISTRDLASLNAPGDLLGDWAPWVGVLVFCVGVYIYNSAPRHTFHWLLLVLLAAWVSQYIGNELFGAYVSAFTGAFAMTVVARAVERVPSGPPALVSFLPAFWLLVPGALGLIGVTEYLAANSGSGFEDFLGTVATIAAIAVGVLCGYPIVGSFAKAYRRVAVRDS